jgi:sortase A
VPRKIIRLIPLLLCLVGIALIAYPYVSDWYYKNSVGNQVVTYEQDVANEDEATIAAVRAEAEDYNRRLASSYVVVTDPFDPSSSIVTNEEYQSLLNLRGDGIMATLYVPKINIGLPVFHGTESTALENGVGHMSSTSLPIGGPSSHSVLAGHNGLPSKKIFDDLDQLEPGDYFIIRVLGEDHAYRVTSKETVLPNDTSSLFIQDGKDLCTLVTCVPYGINTHRLLVHAERCEVPQDWLDRGSGDVLDAAKKATYKPLLYLVLLCAVIALVFILINRRSSRRKEEHAKSRSG